MLPITLSHLGFSIAKTLSSGSEGVSVGSYGGGSRGLMMGGGRGGGGNAFSVCWIRPAGSTRIIRWTRSKLEAYAN